MHEAERPKVVKCPLVGLAVAYAAGIWVGSVLPGSLEIWAGIVAVATVAFFLARSWLLLMWLVVVGAGAVSYHAAVHVRDARHVLHVLEATNPVTGATRLVRWAGLRGVVVSDPTGRGSFFFQVQAVRRDDEWREATGRLWVHVGADHSLRYGDVVELTGSVRVPRAPRNPGQFDWSRWLAQRRVGLTVWVGPRDRLDVVDAAPPSRWRAASLWLRGHLDRAVTAGLQDVPQVGGVLLGMLLGERTEIPADSYRAFQRAGVFHVFAVSGLHVGLVTATVVLALQLVRVPLRWCGLAAVPVVVMYVLATGARPGAVRALWMACVLLVGWSWGMPGNLWNAFGFAALAILVVDPLQLFDGGFQLSFAVVAALLGLTPHIEAWMWRGVAPDPLVPRELWPRWRQTTEKPLRYAVRLVAGSVAAWFGLVPLMAVYFNLFTPLAIMANVVVVPALGLIMGLGLASMVTYPIGTLLATGFNNANYLLVEAMRGVVVWMVNTLGGHWCVQAPALGWTVAYYMLLIAGTRWRAAWLAVPVVIAGMFGSGALNPKVTITVLDVAKGGALFVDVPGERDDLLLDGSDEAGARRVVLPFLRWAGVDRVGVMVLTRADRNHAEGLITVAGELPVARAWHPGYWTRSPSYQQWLAQMTDNGVPLRKARAPMEETLHGGVRVRVFHPPDGLSPRRSDDAVVVLGVEYHGHRVVLLSDASADVLERIADEVIAYRPDAIVQGSDGARWDTFRGFLEQVQPRVAVLAQPPTTRFHPRRRTEGWSGELWRTDDDGAVVITLDRRKVEVRSWRQETAR